MSDVPSNQARPPRGLVGDMHRARQGATATAAELREFVRELRGRSPQEMLGMVAGSNLVRGTVLASIVTLVFMTAFTVGPYVWKKMSPPKVAKKPVAAAPAAASPTNVPSTTAPNATVASSVPGAPTTGSAGAPGTSTAGPASPDVLGRLGIGETKPADPKKNPLDNSTDDLLKDLK